MSKQEMFFTLWHSSIYLLSGLAKPIFKNKTQNSPIFVCHQCLSWNWVYAATLFHNLRTYQNLRTSDIQINIWCTKTFAWDFFRGEVWWSSSYTIAQWQPYGRPHLSNEYHGRAEGGPLLNKFCNAKSHTLSLFAASRLQLVGKNWSYILIFKIFYH